MGFPNIWNSIPRPNLTHLATYICVYMCAWAWAHTHIYTHTYTHTHTGMGAHTHVCIHICAYIQLIVSHYCNYWEFFTSVLADGFSLEFEWQQVSSSFQNFSRYTGQVQQCCSLYGLQHPIIFKSSSSCTNSLATLPRAPITIDIYVTFMFDSFFFKFPSKVEVFIPLFTILSILLCGQPGQQSPQFYKFSLFCWLL